LHGNFAPHAAGATGHTKYAPLRTPSRSSPALQNSGTRTGWISGLLCLVRSRRVQRAQQRALDIQSEGNSTSSGIVELPELLQVPSLVTQVIQSFVDECGNSDAVVPITGKRTQVHISGVRSEAFKDYLDQHGHGAAVQGWLNDLWEKLQSIAEKNDGEPSEDIVVLVGAEEMQVPHLDLSPGQIQIVMALTPTTPTLVYDPKAVPSDVDEIAQSLGLDAEAEEFGYFLKSSLVLPVAEVYKHMVPAYSGEFRPGDAVMVKDGIVHAGPECKEHRMVVFMTFSTHSNKSYEIDRQCKLWDWAFIPSVPPMIAYRRLFEMRDVALKNGMDVRPWEYYPRGGASEACELLCTTPGLDEARVEMLVADWRAGDCNSPFTNSSHPTQLLTDLSRWLRGLVE